MAENKKSIILYVDVISTFENLTDDEAGKLIKHLLRYVNDLNPEPPDKLTQIAFEPIKQQLKRDLIKWESVTNKRSEAGKKGMEKRWQNHNNDITNITSDNTVIPVITKITDTVNVTVTDNVNDNVIIKESKANKFAKPTIDDINLYCIERKNTVDPEKFFNYYESNGWRVGKNPMKNWEACVRTWEKSQNNIIKTDKKPDNWRDSDFN